jgi:hypothetical protein
MLLKVTVLPSVNEFVAKQYNSIYFSVEHLQLIFSD